VVIFQFLQVVYICLKCSPLSIFIISLLFFYSLIFIAKLRKNRNEKSEDFVFSKYFLQIIWGSAQNAFAGRSLGSQNNMKIREKKNRREIMNMLRGEHFRQM
jgi:hypothetical protein